jgi:hypothetical protein
LIEPLRLTMLRRARLGGRLFKVGELLCMEGPGSLRCAWSLVDTKQARPADAATRHAVEMFGACKALDEVKA